LIATSLENRQPCLFFCKLGKDRTGLMAALVLAACGLSEEEIVADYVR
jgi:protein-tyrosine phosphatase